MIYLAEQNEKVLKKNYKKCEKENQEKNKKKWESKEVAFEKKINFKIIQISVLRSIFIFEFKILCEFNG